MFGKSRKTEKERKEKEYGEKDGEKKVEKKDKKGERERRLSGNMRKISVWIRKRLGGKYPGQTEVEENLKLLGPEREVKERAEAYYAEKTGLMLKVLGAGFVLALLFVLTSGSSRVLTEGYFLPRKEKAYTQELRLSMEEGGQENVSVKVEPRALTAEESRDLLEKEVNRMEDYILGENASLEEVRSDLNLIREIEDTPVTVEWELDTYETLNLDGSLRLENLKEEGSLTELTARLVCGEEEEIYRAVVKIYPPIPTEEEQWKETVSEALAAAQQESSSQKMKKLPERIGGVAVSWTEAPSSSALTVLFLTLSAAVLVYVAKDRELKKQVQERERQMQRDYAGIVSKLVLLMGAGAAARNAWETIVKEYQQKRDKGEIKPRFAYEEMALACHEMQSGVAETKVYENFGIRCRLPCYLKLSALLEQNLRKGSKGLSQILNAEILEAFEQRKDCARNQGEEAATRLLFPMVMMLAVVMILILIPAGMSMQM